MQKRTSKPYSLKIERHITEEERKLRYTKKASREAGWSNRRIGRHLGRSDMVVARCWQQWITEGRVYRRESQDVPGTQMIARHPVPSRETIRRRLTEVGLRSRRPLRRLPLTPHHRQWRLDFADLGQLGV
ncbi:hypothetical protein TNCV_2235911 [Trichonephila clavipes]|nr:hypothetical protein TNCV_2235911 [Trichonephila clavipes]